MEETDGLRFLVMPPSLALWPMSRCSSARASYGATVPKCRGAPPHPICGCLLERDLAKPRSPEERLGPSEIAAKTGRRWGVSGRWQSPQVGRSGLSICLMPPSLSRYGSAGWIPAAATAAGLCSGVANCRPVMACWNPEMAICMETLRWSRLLGSRVWPAGPLPVQLGECSQAGWVLSLKISVGFIEDEAVVPGELLPIFLDLAPLHTPRLRRG